MNSVSIKEILDNLSDINIIDIRISQKYNDNHIPYAKSIPSEQLMFNPNKYLSFGKTYYLYCQKGNTSIKVCQALRLKGYKVVSITGGYESWLLER